MSTKTACPKCGAALYSHAHMCARCGWGTKDEREGVHIGKGVWIHGGGHSVRPVMLPDEPYGAEDAALDAREE